MSPYTYAYDAIKILSIVQADIAYDNTETGDKTILIVNEVIWLGDQIEHTLVNPNQLCSYVITVQDNQFSKSPTFIWMEYHEFSLLLVSKGTVLVVADRIPTDRELQTFPLIIILSEHKWYLQNVHFPTVPHTTDEDISMTVWSVNT